MAVSSLPLRLVAEKTEGERQRETEGSDRLYGVIKDGQRSNTGGANGGGTGDFDDVDHDAHQHLPQPLADQHP